MGEHMSEQTRPPYVAQPPVNVYAILAATFAFLVLPPLGIYFGQKAKEQIAVSGERGIELANVGVIAGWILSVLYAVIIVVWCVFMISIISAGTTPFR
jgi:hypothetical protein